jgi:hypothetical protein
MKIESTGTMHATGNRRASNNDNEMHKQKSRMEDNGNDNKIKE